MQRITTFGMHVAENEKGAFRGAFFLSVGFWSIQPLSNLAAFLVVAAASVLLAHVTCQRKIRTVRFQLAGDWLCHFLGPR